MNPIACYRALAACLLIAAIAPASSAAAQRPRAASRPASSLDLRLVYTGYKFVESADEDCPRMRPTGREVLTATLRLVDIDADSLYAEYEGTGRFMADIDGCGLTPNRRDPGMVHDRGQVLGDFHGDNFLGCMVTIFVPEHPVKVRVSVELEDAANPNSVRVEWERASRQPTGARIRSECEPAFDKRYAADLTEQYEDGGAREITSLDLLRTMVRSWASLRDGAYRDADTPEWTYTVGDAPPQDVLVRIEGPTCGCVNLEDAEGAPLQFRAIASEPGGSFTPFVVSAAGSPPRVIANTGGVNPALALAVSPKSGSFTLSLSYTLAGKSWTSPPFAVSVCVMDSITIGTGSRDLAFDAASPGVLSVPAASRAWLDGQDVSDRLAWSLEAMAAPTRLVPGSATGQRVVLAYEGLPTRNSEFGKKKVSAQVNSGPCGCSRETEIRTFFSPLATNHPPGDGGTGADRTDDPNWFYYWLQSSAAGSAISGRVFYQATIPARNKPTDKVTARYDFFEDRVLVSDRVVEVGGCRTRIDATTRRSLGVTSRGIDCFGETLAHEWHHRVEFFAWWPSQYTNNVLFDADQDGVPRSVEAVEPGCSDVQESSCTRRPFDDVTDLEINAYYVGWLWPIGAANSEDWVCGGKQWGGGNCP